jgi:hypothetical protein
LQRIIPRIAMQIKKKTSIISGQKNIQGIGQYSLHHMTGLLSLPSHRTIVGLDEV